MTCCLLDDHALQGGLDLRYLTTRYEKGRAWTNKFLEEHHQHIQVNSMPDTHAELLRFQSAHSDSSDSSLGHQLTGDGNGICFCCHSCFI